MSGRGKSPAARRWAQLERAAAERRRRLAVESTLAADPITVRKRLQGMQRVHQAATAAAPA